MEEPIIAKATNTTLPAPTQCYTCLSPLLGDEKVCAECGCPLSGTADQIDQHRSEYLNLRGQYQGCMQEALKATKSLYWLSGLGVVSNLAVYFLQNNDDYLFAAILVPAVFIPMAIWSRRNPYPALVTALALYILIILSDMIVSPATLRQGWIIKAIIITYLAKGIKAGAASKKLWNQLKDKHWIQPF